LGSTSSNKKEKLSSKLARILNSAMAFIIAYMLIMFLFSLSTAFIGKFFGFDSNISYSGLKFELGRHKWDRLNISIIWSFGTIFTGLLGGFFFYLYSEFKSSTILANLFFLWGSVIAFSVMVAQGILPCLEPGEHLACYTNLTVVFTWLSIPLPILYIFCALFIIFLLFFSIYTSKPFLSFSYTFSKVNKATRKRKYFLETVIAPYLLAGAVLLIFNHFTYPSVNFLVINTVYLITIGISIAVSSLVTNINDIKSEEVMRYKNLQTVSPILFVMVIVLLIVFTAVNKGFYLPF